MPIPRLQRTPPSRFIRKWLPGALGLGMLVLGCQPQHDAETAASTPPVGHYEGSLSPAGQPEVRAALDIRHPRPGHYAAELTVPTAPGLSFVADTMLFSTNQLRLPRPARPGQTLALTLDGDFWRGTLALNSAKIPVILLKRGLPAPSNYQIEEVPQANGSAWLFAPADTSTPGAAIVLLPDVTSAGTVALWGDALAREGLVVLALPAVDSATAPTETPRLQAAFRLLCSTAGVDTANIGTWATGLRAAALAQVLTSANGPRIAFLVAQNADFDAEGRAAFRELANRRFPVLGLYGGATAPQRAAALRNALGGRRGTAVRTYRTPDLDLLVPGGPSAALAPGLPGDVVQWLRTRQ
ncbi:alpha/beta hydrolase family protein [Hymenobacter rubidus]|uniref:hypothetical protein n=1 Tax=Hymenobacter rubidus TaxID=1441626 RepID=UPI00191FF153|nr:hypothetical protein [Hymenobacter rubidus]